MRDLRPALRAARPLVHCITNPIAINDQANIILAAGGRPIMAEHPDEVAEITAGAGALLLNLGNITEVRIRSMERAAAAAARAGVPVTLDLVGVGCSALRREFALRLLDTYPVAVVRGNLSEALAALGRESHALGVDAGDRADDKSRAEVARALARRCSAVVLVSGPVDAVSDGARAALVPGGCELMGRITGTGCIVRPVRRAAHRGRPGGRGARGGGRGGARRGRGSAGERGAAAARAGPDCRGDGAIYPTETKVKTVLTPVARLREIRALGTPCVAIGGLCADNLEVLRGSGADGVAVVRALMRSEDPEIEARTLRAQVSEVLGGAK